MEFQEGQTMSRQRRRRLAEICTYTVLNTIYAAIIIISTVLLVYVLMRSAFTSLEAKDIAFIALYFFPGAILFLCICAGLIFITVATNPMDRHQINLFSFIWICANIVCCGKLNREGGCIQSCETVSRRTGMLFLNMLSIIIAAAIISSIFLPLLVICALYHQGSADSKYGALFIQSATVLIDVLVHLFLMDQYRYYSLAVIICGMSYIFIGLTACYFSKVIDLSFRSFMWIQFEIVSLWMMLTISFAVRYEPISGLHLLIVAFFINFVCPNLPFSKLYLFEYFIENIAVRKRRAWTFITGNNVISDDWTTLSRKEMRDRFYYILHSALHSELNFSSVSIDESTALIHTESSNQNNGHSLNSPQCFKLQHDYHRSSGWRKSKIINKMHPNYRYVVWMDIGIAIYTVSSVVALLYPMVWFLVFWVYLEEMEGIGMFSGFV